MGQIYCSRCGAANPDDSKFCARCGSPITKSREPESSAVEGAPVGAGAAGAVTRPKEEKPVSVGEWLGFGALTLLIPVLGQILGLIMGIVWSAKRRKGGVGFLIFACVVIFLGMFILPMIVAIALPNFLKISEKAKEAELKQNLHSIQLSLERYAVDNDGLYPSDIHELIDDGYLFKFPRNPFGDETVMKPVNEGEWSPGDFVYIPIPDDEGKIANFILKVYGADEDTGYIMELAGGLVIEYD